MLMNNAGIVEGAVQGNVQCIVWWQHYGAQIAMYVLSSAMHHEYICGSTFNSKM